MYINPAAAAAVAGTSRAAAKGGDSDVRASQDTARQATGNAPGGKDAADSSIQGGDQTSDRDGNGRQLLDRFERSDEQAGDEQDDAPEDHDDGRRSTHPGQLDLEA